MAIKKKNIQFKKLKDHFKRNKKRFNSISLLEDKRFYGKVDAQGDLVMPSENFLKVSRYNQKVFALDFVIHSLDNLLNALYKKISFGRIKQDSVLFGLRPVSGWESLDQLFKNHLNIAYNYYVHKFIQENIFIESVSFFLDKFLHFYNQQMFTINRSTYIKNSTCPNEMSGFIINLNKQNERWPSDRFFNDWLILANSFGFYVDNERPWRIIANLNSQVIMQETAESMFKNKFYNIELSEIENMQLCLWQIYSNVVKLRPEVVKPYVNKNYSTKARSFKPNQLSLKQFVDKLDRHGWIMVYLQTRAIELKVLHKLDKSIIDSEVATFDTIEMRFGILSAVRYINNFLGNIK